MPPALRGMLSYAIRKHWPTLLVYEETGKRDSPLIILWRGREYRIFCEEK